MQHGPALQQLRARRALAGQQGSWRTAAQRTAARHARPATAACCSLALPLPPHRLPGKRAAANCGATADGAAGSGDVVRPSAKAAAPTAHTPVDVTGGADGSSSSASSTAGTSSSSSSSNRSYSEFYKVLHSSTYASSQHAQHSSSTAGGSSSGSSGGSDGSTQPVADGSSSQQVPAAAGGDGAPHGAAVAAASNGHAAAASSSIAAAPPAASVEDAIRKAQAALAAAEDSLSSIHTLRSAQPPSRWAAPLQVLRSAALALAAGAALVASHAFGLGWQWAAATLGALAVAGRAYYSGALSMPGAGVAAAACLATLGCSLRFGLVLLAAAYSSMKLRQAKEGRLQLAPPDAEAAAAAAQQGQRPRDWTEVATATLAPTVLAVAYGAMAGCLDLPLGSLPAVEAWRADLLTLLQGGVLGWYACCCGDAWSSELGALSSDQPRLLTTLQPVRRGTHGGVTLLGLSAAAAGGLLVGLVFYCAAVLSPTLWVFEPQRHAAMAQWRLVPLGLMAGLLGSLLDSLLGAMLQFTGYDAATSRLCSTPGPSVRRISGLPLPWLGDNAVNVLAASLTAALTALAALRMFG